MDDNNANSVSLENPTRFFLLDSENYDLQKSEETQHINLPNLDPSLLDSDDHFISPLSQSFVSVKSIDQRIKEAIKPVMEDIDILKPYKFNKLLKDTHSLLVKEIAQIESREIKKALISLIELLKKNADLVNLFQKYTNWLQKA
jgi:hypothetical protein